MLEFKQQTLRRLQETVSSAAALPGQAGARVFDPSPIPWQVAPWHDQSRILLFTGGAGGGKSRLGIEMAHHFMGAYPGAMGLMVRKTRESMRNSTVLFFNTRIAAEDSRVQLVTSNHRFQYTNGSFLAYGGMKDEEQREQIRSIGRNGALDFVLIEEANRLHFEDFQEVLPRLRGKAGPYCQVILMTNPDAPSHWINQKLMLGGMAKTYISFAKDNPFNPPEYLEWLSMLTGVQYERLVLGKWVQAEGVVYDNFSAIGPTGTSEDSNVSLSADYDPALGLLEWGCDDGYARGEGLGTLSYHPRVILLAQETKQGGLNVFDEYYRVEEPSYEASIADVLARPYPRPDAAFCDSSAAMFRANLMNHGIMTSGATHPVTEGIRNLRRMICDGKGMRLLKIHPRCVNLISEFQSYRYDDTAQVAGDRKPLKMDDHGVDACRYLTWHLRYEMS